MAERPLLKALLPTGVVAGAFGFSILSVFQESFWRFWGFFFGFFVTILSYGVAVWILQRRTRGRLGRRITIGVLVFFGLWVTSWAVSWGFDPLSLEGLWIYPLGLLPLIAGAYLIWSERSRRSDIWAAPPAVTPPGALGRDNEPKI